MIIGLSMSLDHLVCLTANTTLSVLRLSDSDQPTIFIEYKSIIEVRYAKPFIRYEYKLCQ